MIQRTHLLARGILISRDGKVLVAQAKGHRNTFLPGGHVEPGESMTVALAREMEEKLGASCRVGAYLGAVEHQWPEVDPTDYEVNHLFLVEADLPEDLVALESQLQFRWVAPDDLVAANLQPYPLQSLISEYLKGTRSVFWASTLA